MALASALADTPAPADVVSFGEIGLTGHIRAVGHTEARLREAVRHGFSRAIAKSGTGSPDSPLTIIEASTLGDALGVLGS